MSSVSARVLHERLGHLSFKCLDTLRSQYPDDAPCYVCPLAKQRRLSFPSHNNRSQHAFELVHCDIWGPYHISTISGYRYFLILVDDCTRFTWVFLLRHKSDVTFILPHFWTRLILNLTTKSNSLGLIMPKNWPSMHYSLKKVSYISILA